MINSAEGIFLLMRSDFDCSENCYLVGGGEEEGGNEPLVGGGKQKFGGEFFLVGEVSKISTSGKTLSPPPPFPEPPVGKTLQVVPKNSNGHFRKIPNRG